MATDAKRKVINANIILYGPAKAGKTSNIQFIHRKLKPSQRGQISTLCQDGYPDVSYEFLPIELGELKGYDTNLYIYTAPASDDGLETRLNLLHEAAGVVFIADSHPEKMEENLESLANLKEELKYWDIDYDSFPVVIQYNKRDLAEVATIDELESQVNPEGKPSFEAVAAAGQGVRDTFALVSKMAVRRVRLQLVARERAARDDEGARKVRGEVEVAQFGDREGATAGGEGKAPGEVTLETAPPPREEEEPVRGEGDDSQELVHEASREGADAVAGAEDEVELEPLGEEAEAALAREDEASAGSEASSPDAVSSDGMDAAAEAADVGEDTSGSSDGAIGSDAGSDEAEAVAGDTGGSDGAEAEEAGTGVEPDGSETGEEAGAGEESAEPGDEGVEGGEESAELEDEHEPSEAADMDAVPTDESSTGTGPASGDEGESEVLSREDFLKTSFSFGEPDEVPEVVDVMEGDEAVLALEADEVGVVAVGAEEEEFDEEISEEEEVVQEEEGATPLSLRDAPSLAAIAFVPSLDEEPDVKIQTYADEDDEDEGPVIRLGARAYEEEELQLDDDMLLEDAGDLDEELDLEEEEAAADGADSSADEEAPVLEEAAVADEEPVAEDRASLDTDLEEVAEADLQADEESEAQQDEVSGDAAEESGLETAAEAPAEAPVEEVADAHVEETTGDASEPTEESGSDLSELEDGAPPVAAPSESTLDLPEEAVDSETGESGEGAALSDEGGDERVEEAPSDLEAGMEGEEAGGSLEADGGLQEGEEVSETGEPGAGAGEEGAAADVAEEARLAPGDEEEVIFESIVEAPVDEYVPPVEEAELEETQPLTGPERAEVVSWGETVRVDASTLRLPVVVRLPSGDEVSLGVTIHVDKLTEE